MLIIVILVSNLFVDSKNFVTNVERDLLNENINVYGFDGHLVSIPEGATVVDFAYSCEPEFADKMVGAFVNGKTVDVGTLLHSGDRVHIITADEKIGPSSSWISDAALIETQKMIRKRLGAR